MVVPEPRETVETAETIETAEPRGFADWLQSIGAKSVAGTQGPEGIRAAAQAAALANGYGRRPWFVFETSANPAGRATALALCGPGACLSWLSSRALGFGNRHDHCAEVPGTGSPAHPPLAIETIADMDATLVGVAGAHPDLLPELAALVVRGELDLDGAAQVVALADLMDTGAGLVPAADGARALVVTLPD